MSDGNDGDDDYPLWVALTILSSELESLKVANEANPDLFKSTRCLKFKQDRYTHISKKSKAGTTYYVHNFALLAYLPSTTE